MVFLRMILFVVSLCILSIASVGAWPAWAGVTTRPDDIVDIKQIDPSIRVDMMYAGSGNFMGRPVTGYKASVCFVTKTAGEALKLAQGRLREYARQTGEDLSLFMRDCYRPQKSVQEFVRWSQDLTDDKMKSSFYPDLTKAEIMSQHYISPASTHSRASTVDLTIVRVIEGHGLELLPMGGTVDFFGERSHTDFAGISAEEKQNRQLLKRVLSPEFKNYDQEWWHYGLKVEPYPKTFFDFDVEKPTSRTPQSVDNNEVTVQVTNPKLLAILDHDNRSPLALTAIFQKIHGMNGLAAPALNPAGNPNGEELAAFTTTYAKFADVIKADVARVIAELGIDWEKDITKTYDTASARTPQGKVLRQNGNVTRFFNDKWLTSKMGRFLLAGIMNRVDRRDFTPGTCGEVRFIYRLGYETQMGGKTFASRMPFTLNLVFNYKDDGQQCRDVAGAWQIQALEGDDPTVIASRLLNGPVDFSKLVFKQMEVNAQIARFPSDLENVENRKFAGQAIYLMRIFNVKDGLFQPKKLENTPDVLQILHDPAKRAELSTFISTHMSEIDQGIFLLPESLLADVALTYSTLGSSRLANRPFNVLFTDEQAQGLVAAASGATSTGANVQFVTTGRALLERLNTSSCMGCHQSSSTAGFHMLGHDRSDFAANASGAKTALDGNRLVLPFSPHLYAELPRRAQWTANLAAGQAVGNFRPHPSAPAANWQTGPTFLAAGANMPCPLGEDLGAGARWSCEKGFTCSPIVTNDVFGGNLGQCVPAAGAIYGGLTCRTDVVHSGPPAAAGKFSYNVSAFQDRVVKDELLYKLPEGPMSGFVYNCRPTRIGVPLGRVTKPCTPAQMALQDLKLGDANQPVPSEMCAVVGGKGFEEMAKGYFDSQKFAAGVGRGILNTCSPTKHCREDYICQEMPDFLANARFNVKPEVIQMFRQKKIGFCTPTYFVYQLRLDGHPNP